MSEIKAGDVVALKSGSPELTVLLVEGGIAYVAWFNDCVSSRDDFPVDALTPVKSAD